MEKVYLVLHKNSEECYTVVFATESRKRATSFTKKLRRGLFSERQRYEYIHIVNVPLDVPVTV